MKPDFQKRQKRLAELMKKKNVEAVLTSDKNDIYYYTGYLGFKDDAIFMLFPADRKPKIIATLLESEIKTVYPHVMFIKKFEDLFKIVRPYRTIGFDERKMNVLLYKKLKKLKLSLKPFEKFIKMQRVVKDEYEMDQIKKAIRVTKKAFKYVEGRFTGKSEIEIAEMIDMFFKKHHVENAFENIVSSGEQSSFVHHKPNEKIVKSCEHVLVDIGCKSNGYCSDLTRVFGRLTGKKKAVFEDVKEIHDVIFDNIASGVSIEAIERLQEKLFRKKGYKVCHSFGHSVGLDVHDPMPDTLKENMVMTIEPGIYIKGIGGFRIENMILIKKNKAEMLS